MIVELAISRTIVGNLSEEWMTAKEALLMLWQSSGTLVIGGAMTLGLVFLLLSVSCVVLAVKLRRSLPIPTGGRSFKRLSRQIKRTTRFLEETLTACEQRDESAAMNALNKCYSELERVNELLTGFWEWWPHVRGHCTHLPEAFYRLHRWEYDAAAELIKRTINDLQDSLSHLRYEIECGEPLRRAIMAA